MTRKPIANRIVGEGMEAPDQLLANPLNWRIHPHSQEKALTAVLEEVGWVQRVIVNRTTGFVVDGHLRVALAISRGEAEIPVTYVELTPEEEALVLASLDPLAGMAVTDEALLKELTAGLTVTDADLAALLGLGDEPGMLTDPDEVPEVPVDPVTKPGDLWLLGEHRLLCGDSTDDAALDRLFVGKVGCVLTDPPYGIDLDTDYSGRNGGKNSMLVKVVIANTYRRVAGDAVPFDASGLSARFASVKEQFWFGGNYYRRTLPGGDLDGSWLVWDKRPSSWEPDGGNIDDVPGSGFELVWCRQKHQQRMLRHQWSGFTARNRGLEREHPTEKPVVVLEDILSRWAPAGCIVADPFAGSGTTLIAAEQTGRTCYAMEIDPAYCDVIVQRWENATGNEAKLA